MTSPHAEARAARRRHAATRWDRLPPHLGIDVRPGRVATDLAGGARPQPWLQVAPGRAVVDLVGPARIEVCDGTEITVDVTPEVAASGDLGWIVHGWGVATAMLQRGLLVVHASAVEVGGAAVLVAGQTGAGKSTTALGLRARGHRLLVDDVSTIVDVDGRPHVLPFLRGVNLTPAAADALGIAYADLPALSAGRGKATFLAEDPGSRPIPVAAVAVIEPDADLHDVRVEPVGGAGRFGALAPHCRRDGAASAILGPDRLFARTAALAAATPVARIARPAGSWHLDAVCAAVEDVRTG